MKLVALSYASVRVYLLSKQSVFMGENTHEGERDDKVTQITWSVWFSKDPEHYVLLLTWSQAEQICI